MGVGTLVTLTWLCALQSRVVGTLEACLSMHPAAFGRSRAPATDVSVETTGVKKELEAIKTLLQSA
jgi:hypothetical protein